MKALRIDTTRFPPNEAADDPSVESLRVKFFRKPASVGYGGAADCASLAFFNCCARSDEQGTADSVIEVNAWADDRPAVAGQVRPAVAVDIILFLIMSPAQQCVAPPILHRLG